uniref:N-acetyltransferase GCN5 n=1 Tax=Mycena chlorophos TaxID=658473 RepID=A0ABQ0LZK5_MYCCL|nr:N-acetyltransferase GCN5 [Mycena chlorophos]
MTITLRDYTKTDFEPMVNAFDARIAWLTSKGHTGQWGSEPLAEERVVEMRALMAPEHAAAGVRGWVAEDSENGTSAGWLVVTPMRSEYVPGPTEDQEEDKPGKECWLKLLLVNPEFGGRKVGDLLLEQAAKYAREDGAVWLRLDCWRGPEGQDGLVRYYESKGFTKVRPFVAPGRREKEWAGQLLEMKI